MYYIAKLIAENSFLFFKFLYAFSRIRKSLSDYIRSEHSTAQFIVSSENSWYQILQKLVRKPWKILE